LEREHGRRGRHHKRAGGDEALPPGAHARVVRAHVRAGIDMTASGDASDTQRVDALSDGVFAIAMTLLGAELQIAPRHAGSLGDALLAAWPSYLSFLMSFTTIAIIWVNHHRLFLRIRKIDHSLLIYNGLLLMITTMIPFTTRILADNINSRTEHHTATFLYSAVLCGLTGVFNLLWRHAAKGARLLDRAVEPRLIARISRQYGFGPVFYAVSCGLALVNPWVSLAADFLIALFFALPVWNLGMAAALRSDAARPGRTDEGGPSR
jgi:uncharacterized membrane protein